MVKTFTYISFNYHSIKYSFEMLLLSFSKLLVILIFTQNVVSSEFYKSKRLRPAYQEIQRIHLMKPKEEVTGIQVVSTVDKSTDHDETTSNGNADILDDTSEITPGISTETTTEEVSEVSSSSFPSTTVKPILRTLKLRNPPRFMKNRNMKSKEEETGHKVVKVNQGEIFTSDTEATKVTTEVTLEVDSVKALEENNPSKPNSTEKPKQRTLKLRPRLNGMKRVIKNRNRKHKTEESTKTTIAVDKNTHQEELSNENTESPRDSTVITPDVTGEIIPEVISSNLHSNTEKPKPRILISGTSRLGVKRVVKNRNLQKKEEESDNKVTTTAVDKNNEEIEISTGSSSTTKASTTIEQPSKIVHEVSKEVKLISLPDSTTKPSPLTVKFRTPAIGQNRHKLLVKKITIDSNIKSDDSKHDASETTKNTDTQTVDDQIRNEQQSTTPITTLEKSTEKPTTKPITIVSRINNLQKKSRVTTGKVAASQIGGNRRHDYYTTTLAPSTRTVKSSMYVSDNTKLKYTPRIATTTKSNVTPTVGYHKTNEHLTTSAVAKTTEKPSLNSDNNKLKQVSQVGTLKISDLTQAVQYHRNNDHRTTQYTTVEKTTTQQKKVDVTQAVQYQRKNGHPTTQYTTVEKSTEKSTPTVGYHKNNEHFTISIVTESTEKPSPISDNNRRNEVTSRKADVTQAVQYHRNNDHPTTQYTTVEKAAQKSTYVSEKPNVQQTPVLESQRRTNTARTRTSEYQRSNKLTSTTPYPTLEKDTDRSTYVPIIGLQNYVYAYNGDYHYSYEGGDGTKAFESGDLRVSEDNANPAGVIGGYSYKDKDGNDISLSYTAGKDGYRPVGDHLPTSPPIPPAIQRVLRILATKTTPEPVTESVTGAPNISR